MAEMTPDYEIGDDVMYASDQRSVGIPAKVLALTAPAEYEGLPPVTAQIKQRARKISGVEFSEAQQLETAKKSKSSFSKRFEDNKTPEALLNYAAYQRTLKFEDQQFPTQKKTLDKFNDHSGTSFCILLIEVAFHIFQFQRQRVFRYHRYHHCHS